MRGVGWRMLAWGVAALLVCAVAEGAQSDDPAALAGRLGGADATAEALATARLMEMGDSAVAALADVARSGRSFTGRMIAVELLGRIGSPDARERLLGLLGEESNLALRGQIVMQLGQLRERRAVPIIAKHLATVGPRALDDVRGGKEFQPSTCYLRHIEALAMIGDEKAIPILEDFRGKIPKGIGFGGFISNFVDGGVQEALEELKEQAGFWNAVRGRAGLEEKIGPLLVYFRSDPVARFRLYEDQMIRHTDEGKAILGRLASHADPAIAGGAKALFSAWDELGGEAR